MNRRMRILESLPALYQPLLAPFFSREIAPESKATCDRCAMCESTATERVESADGRSHFFSPDTKCCTYHPRLPNYLVGALLADTHLDVAEGRRRVRERIAAHRGATPMWLKPPAQYSVLYDRANNAFGRATSLLCPYYVSESGACGVWRFREAVCSTYFCKYVEGADGRAFWTSLKTFVTVMEIQLSRYALHQVMPAFIEAGQDREEASSDAKLTVDDLEHGAIADDAYRALWGEWIGREEALYRACFDAVRALDANGLERVLGFDGVAGIARLQKLHDVMTETALPDRLRFNPGATVKWLGDGSVAFASYSEFDAVALPGEAYALLTLFDGRATTGAVRERMRRERGADLDDDVLRVLYRQRVLTSG